MKHLLVCVFGLILQINGYAQYPVPDSLKAALKEAKEDTIKFNILLNISSYYLDSAPEGAVSYGMQALELARKLKYQRGSALALKNIGSAYYFRGNTPAALDYYNQALVIYDSLDDLVGKAKILNNFGTIYYMNGADDKALENYFKSLEVAEKIGALPDIATGYFNIANVYDNKPATKDKAIGYFLKSLLIAERINANNIIGAASLNLGQIYQGLNKDDSALYFYNKSLKAYANTINLPYPLRDIGLLYAKKGDFRNAIHYNEQSYQIARGFDSKLDMTQSLKALGDIYLKKEEYNTALISYKQADSIARIIPAYSELDSAYSGLAATYSKLGDFNNAYRYQKMYSSLSDSLNNQTLADKLTSLQGIFELKEKAYFLEKDKMLLEAGKEQTINKIKIYSLVGGLSSLIILAIILLRNNRQKAITNLLLGKQKGEIQNTLNELKSTQKQLIQSEKMASLGELAAGIAHEIQNPLNFVNNFSEVNSELIDDMQEELNAGNNNEAISISKVIKGNQEKINHHGKRADAIVKGMLQHSRESKGQIVLTDINPLTDEYLRLSYQGLRARDKAFQASLQTKFDPGVSKINIIPQDIGRVLLNLYNNAFYAVSERKKQQPEGYEPTVSVSTRKVDNKVSISVKDNGNGIPEKVKDKIFQPFFTTKPTGQGTGLGLSLSYDIIKAHGGEIIVNTKEGAFTEFTILLNA